MVRMTGFDQLWHRRAVLAAMAGLAVRPVVPLDAHARANADPFGLGVASGDPTVDGFVLWTRLIGPGAEPLRAATVAIRYEMATDPQFRAIVRRGRGGAYPERAHAVHVEIAGLPAGRPYWYRFHALGATSPTGRAVTAPRVADRLRLAVTSCQHWEQALFVAYRDIVAAEPDLILQLGDYIYEQAYPDLPRVRSFGSPEPRDLAGYRQRHALYKTDPDLQAAHRACPWVAIWDDHEVLNDYAGLANREAQPPALFALRRAAAYQAYFEHMPIRPRLWRDRRAPQLYRAVDWGDLVSMSVLDTRQYRSAPACAPPHVAHNVRLDHCAEASAPDRTILGAAQERWLSDRLTRERRQWTLVGQQIFFAPLWLDDARTATFSDQWDGYAANRARLLRDMQRPAVTNPVILSGDVHSFWANRLDGDDGAVAGTEFVTSAIAAAPPPAGRFGDVARHNPHIRFHDVRHAGWTRIDIDRARMRVDMRMIANSGEKAGLVRSGGSFIVEAGTRGLLEA
jgi:alkaline phosphatase D